MKLPPLDGGSFTIINRSVMMMHMLVLGIVTSVFLGLCVGSFAGASVWRLRARELAQLKKGREEYDKHEYARLKPLLDRKVQDDRSMCLHCGHTLAWYDLLPLLSWLSTKGKCRYCHQPIGRFEPMMELGGAALFGISVVLWVTLGFPLLLLPIWFILCGCMLILFAYDLRWYVLPDMINIPFIALSWLMLTLGVFTGNTNLDMLSLIGAIIVFPGLYWALYMVSKGEWVGFGDVKLTMGLVALLPTWQQSFTALFLANLLGCLVVIPGMLSKKLTRKTAIPFGPFLMIGGLIAFFLGGDIISIIIGLI